MKKIISYILLGVLFITSFYTGIDDVNATALKNNYPKIVLNVPNISQKPGACGITSMAIIEASFFNQKTSSNPSKSNVYKLVEKVNNSKDNKYANWSKVGYEKVSCNMGNAYLEGLYKELSNGYPVIVWREQNNSPYYKHYAVVYGYNGSTTKLTKSGFLVLNDVEYPGSCKKTDLESWLKGCWTNHYVVRRKGLANGSSLVNNITFAVNHPAYYHEIGTSQAVYGTIVSNKKITNVKVGVYKSNGTAVFETSSKPNSTSYNITNLDSKMKFKDKIKTAGNYTYKITAKDSANRTKTYTYPFKAVKKGSTISKIYYVYYNANGGTGSMANTTVTYGVSTKLRANSFTRSGYTFTGWNVYRKSDGKWIYKNASGSEGWYVKGKQPSGYSLKVYSNQASVSKTSSVNKDVVTMYAVWKQSATAPSTPSTPASTLSIKNQYYPSKTYALGSVFTISGAITSNYTITNVTAKVTTTSGTQKFVGSASPNKTSYSLYNLDSQMSFSKLPVGNYVYTVTATDAKGTKTLIKSNFSVKTSNITSSNMNYPTTLAKGSYFTIKGTVGSSDKLKNVTAIVHTVDGVYKFSSSVNTSAKTYDVYKLDSNMAFRSLPAGEYIYRVSVVDSKGVEKFVVTKKFTVK